MPRTPGRWYVGSSNQRTDVISGPMGAMAYVSTAGARGRTLQEAQDNAGFIATATAVESVLPDLFVYDLALVEVEVRFSDGTCKTVKAVDLHKALQELQPR